ncbi:hypothetical protein CMI42_00585 [Candidatus Pacearchaeota archaeon]|nr:hypothetical protein [Candidatus Pacearchaeota archaeon]|tara:strand:+ start:182 stop:571 length:390 start_codon:yes stop_codon:yes gene_type:complete
MEKVGKIINQVVLDTDCLIQLEKGDLSVVKVLDGTDSLFITSITVFEFAFGRSFDEEDNRLDEYNVIPFNEKDGLLSAKMLKELIRDGKEVEFRDVFIASICIDNKIPLLTRNIKHFERFREYGLRLVG